MKTLTLKQRIAKYFISRFVNRIHKKQPLTIGAMQWEAPMTLKVHRWNDFPKISTPLELAMFQTGAYTPSIVKDFSNISLGGILLFAIAPPSVDFLAGYRGEP